MDKCTKCRKFGVKLFLKGDRCNSPKCAITRRNYRPGAHGPKQGNLRKSEYGLQLLEKQKMKAEYGLRERQFVNIFHKAAKSRTNTAHELFKILEMRLDNIVYRLGWAASRAQARQFVNHRKFKLNEKIVNIPSTVLKPKDIITPVNKDFIKPVKVNIPQWIKVDAKDLKAEILDYPKLEEIETDIDSQLIIEFYSR